MTPDDVLSFWFGPPGSSPFENEPVWWRKDDAFDTTVRERFGAAIDDAGAGRLASWEAAPRSSLALVILMDQFSRNAYRGTPRSFALDRAALDVVRRMIARRADTELGPAERAFVYLPFMHAEDLAAQDEGLVCFAILVEETPEALRPKVLNNLIFGVKHRRIIERFGRFPHRNAILGRASTDAELAFLKEPGSSF